jgi:hypothetical protein
LQRLAAAREQLDTHPRQLCVPGLEDGVHRGRRHRSLEQMVTTIEHAPVAPDRRRVRREHLRGEPVEEAAARLRPSGQECEILPPKGDRARPWAPLAGDRPAPVLAGRDGAADLPDGIGAPELPLHERARRVPAGEVHGAAATERATHEEETEAFEEVGLALSVGPGDYVERRRR